MLTAFVTTLVTVFGAAPDHTGAAVVGVLALVAFAAVVAATVGFGALRPSPDTGMVRIRVIGLRRRAAGMGVVFLHDPAAPGRIRPRAPGGQAMPA